MSFILEALKKAESERSRQAGPVLMDMRVARSRQRLPAWAWLLGVILLANLAVLTWVLVRKPAGPANTAPLQAANVAPTSTPVPLPETPVAAPVALGPPISLPATSSVSAAPAEAAPTQLPALAPQQPKQAQRPASAAGDLPTLQEIIASGVSLPALTMNLHVYDELPANRYALINSKKVREGDDVIDGLHVELITPRGVVLSTRGRRFLMLAGS